MKLNVVTDISRINIINYENPRNTLSGGENPDRRLSYFHGIMFRLFQIADKINSRTLCLNWGHPKIMLLLPKRQNLPNTFPLEGAVRIELVEGIPLFRASSTVQERIETLLEKQQNYLLNYEEEQELDLYEQIGDYLSFVNRTVRNLYLTQNQSDI